MIRHWDLDVCIFIFQKYRRLSWSVNVKGTGSVGPIVFMHVCMAFMALTFALVLCARSRDSLLSMSVRRIHVLFSNAGLRAEKSRVLRHVKPPRCGEVSTKPRALNWGRTLNIGALARNFIRWDNRAPFSSCFYFSHHHMQTVNGKGFSNQLFVLSVTKKEKN